MSDKKLNQTVTIPDYYQEDNRRHMIERAKRKLAESLIDHLEPGKWNMIKVNHMIMTGWPDNIGGQSHRFWIEIKHVEEPDP